jgi:transglutaminase superfamily protein
MHSRLVQFQKLGFADQRTLIAAATGLPLVWLGLHLLGLSRIHALLTGPPLARTQPMPFKDMQALAGVVNIAARHSWGATCLTRSLLLIWLLRRRGIHTQLRIGVRLAGGGLAAHSWVELGDLPVNDQPDVRARFAPFSDLVPLKAFRAR